MLLSQKVIAHFWPNEYSPPRWSQDGHKANNGSYLAREFPH